MASEVIDIRERIDELEEKNKEYSLLLEISPWKFSKEELDYHNQIVQFFYGSVDQY